MNQAFTLLRDHARSRNLRLSHLAQAFIGPGSQPGRYSRGLARGAGGDRQAATTRPGGQPITQVNGRNRQP
jgi:hypothetical protein